MGLLAESHISKLLDNIELKAARAINILNIHVKVTINKYYFTISKIQISLHSPTVPYGLVARIPGFHPGGSGSIPGMGICVLRDT